MYTKRINESGIRENKYYTSNENPYVASGYGMPNCTCYCFGRASEILGRRAEGLSLHNGKYWYNESNGFDKGQTPKLGAIMCFTGKYGHVSVVEEIKDNGDVVCSNSNYGGTYFYLTTHTKASGYNNYDPNLKFEGFIYVYRGEDENGKVEVQPQKSIEEIANEVIKGIWGNGNERKERLTNAGYDYMAIQNKVNEIVNRAPSQKSIDKIAREVIRGQWGNGADRKQRLTNAGYDYTAIQNKVNELL